MKKLRFSALFSLFFVLTFTPTAAASHGLASCLSWIAMTIAGASGKSWVNKYSSNVDIEKPLYFDLVQGDNVNSLGVGSYGDGSFIGEFNSNGNVVWQDNFEGFHFKRILKEENNFYAVGDSEQNFGDDILYGPAIVRFDVEDESSDVAWVKQPALGFYTEIHDAAVVRDGALMVVGDVYGAFTNNESFTLQPRGALIHYDKYGANFWAAAVSASSARWDNFHSINYESDNNIVSITGMSGYDTGNATMLSMPLVRLSYGLTEPGFNSTMLYLMINDHNISTTQGIVGYSHTDTSDGGYVMTGSIFTLNNVTKYQLFVGKVNNESVPEWFRFIDEMDDSVGFTAVEHGGHYVVGGYKVDNNNPRLLIINLEKEEGALVSARLGNVPGYNISIGFSLKVGSNGDLYMTGGTASNDTLDGVTKLLLHKTDNILECTESVNLNFPLLEGIARISREMTDFDVPEIYTFDQSAPIETVNTNKMAKNNICYETNSASYLVSAKNTVLGTMLFLFFSLY